MEPRILITGGLGFLGHHLSRALLVTFPRCRLTIVDNLSSSRIDYRWLSGLADIRIGDFLEASFEGERFDRIYHLASPVGSLGILRKTGYVAKEITDLAVRAGELAAATGADLLYVSSSEIYGKPGLQREDDVLSVPEITGTRMEYGLGKLAGEHLLRNMARRAGFRLTICRPFNVTGEHQSSRIGFVIPTFFERALAGLSLPLFHGGGQKRCFCYAADMAEGLVAVQERGRDGEIYNLGNPGNLASIRDIAQKVRLLCGSTSDLEHLDPTTVHGRDFIEAPEKLPSIAKVSAHTGWTPRTGLEALLHRCHRHFTGKGDGKGFDGVPAGVAVVKDGDAAVPL